jgi:FMN hydrolase / 5-amino-6-(5-phospho-D-ribitylamino)uracil phosphatase
MGGPTIEAVLFDGDQTLWDFQKVMRVALLAVLEELRAARPGPAAALLTVGDLQEDRTQVALELEGIEYNLRRLRALGFARTLRRLHRAHNAWRPEGDNALVEQLTSSYFTHRDRDPALFDDTIACLSAMRARYRVGLLSNGSRLPESIGLGHCFDCVVFAQDHQVAKPDRGIFAVVERALDLPPGACVLVGDHPRNDVVGAKRAGWRAVWIDRDGDGVFPPPAGHAERPDAIITSLDDLGDVLRSL